MESTKQQTPMNNYENPLKKEDPQQTQDAETIQYDVTLDLENRQDHSGVILFESNPNFMHCYFQEIPKNYYTFASLIFLNCVVQSWTKPNNP